MASFGDGSSLWRVDVVLRGAGAVDPTDAVLRLLRERLAGRAHTSDEALFDDVLPTSSYDMNPPEGGVGISIWVRADTAGAAAQAGHDVVTEACREVSGVTHDLWDLRVMPRAAMVDRDADERDVLIAVPRRFPRRRRSS